jgi:hypothetical protein
MTSVFYLVVVALYCCKQYYFSDQITIFLLQHKVHFLLSVHENDVRPTALLGFLEHLLV